MNGRKSPPARVALVLVAPACALRAPATNSAAATVKVRTCVKGPCRRFSKQGGVVTIHEGERVLRDIERPTAAGGRRMLAPRRCGHTRTPTCVSVCAGAWRAMGATARLLLIFSTVLPALPVPLRAIGQGVCAAKGGERRRSRIQPPSCISHAWRLVEGCASLRGQTHARVADVVVPG